MKARASWRGGLSPGYLQTLSATSRQGTWEPDRIAQVITNLVSNAAKYSPEGTPITVRLQGSEDTAVLEVHNTGDPIPADLLPRLFQPMQRGGPGMDRTTRSVGLGLYIVRHIVDAHGGTIDVASTLEMGTTFTVRLPRQALCSQADVGCMSPAPASSSRTRRASAMCAGLATVKRSGVRTISEPMSPTGSMRTGAGSGGTVPR